MVPVLFAPLAPGDIAAKSTTLDAIRWLLLDCKPEPHQMRLAERDWSAQSIAASVGDAEELRRECTDVVMTDNGSPRTVAVAVLDWVHAHSG